MKFTIGFLLLIFSSSIWACDPERLGELYWPNPLQGDSRYFFDAIRVELSSVSRGGPEAPCGNAGIVEFEVKFSIESIAERALDSIGIYIVAKSPDERGMLPSVPVPIKPEQKDDGRYYISFAWGDPYPQNLEDLYLEYEVFYISNQLMLSEVKHTGTIEALGVNQ